jgi:hypothetical protein
MLKTLRGYQKGTISRVEFDNVAGTQLMSLAEMLDFVEDKAEFEEMLRTMDIPASAVKNPTCIGKLTRKEPLAVNDLRFLRTLTSKPVKITLPGPYLLTRSMWVGALTHKAYRNHKKMADDIVKILREELLELRAAISSSLTNRCSPRWSCRRTVSGELSCERRLPPAGMREKNWNIIVRINCFSIRTAVSAVLPAVR